MATWPSRFRSVASPFISLTPYVWTRQSSQNGPPHFGRDGTSAGRNGWF